MTHPLHILADRVEGLSRSDNATDVLVEVATLVPDEDWRAVRANDAGTKVIYTDKLGANHTHWALEFPRLFPGEKLHPMFETREQMDARKSGQPS